MLTSYLPRRFRVPTGRTGIVDYMSAHNNEHFLCSYLVGEGGVVLHPNTSSIGLIITQKRLTLQLLVMTASYLHDSLIFETASKAAN